MTSYIKEFDAEHGPDYVDHGYRRYFSDGAWRGTDGSSVQTCEPSTDLKQRQDAIIYYHRLILTRLAKQFNQLKQDLKEGRFEPSDENVSKLKDLQKRAKAQEALILKIQTDHERQRNQPAIDQYSKQRDEWISKLQSVQVQLESARSKRDRGLVAELEVETESIERSLHVALHNLARLGIEVPDEFQYLVDNHNAARQAVRQQARANKDLIERLEV